MQPPSAGDGAVPTRHPKRLPDVTKAMSGIDWLNSSSDARFIVASIYKGATFS